MAYLLPPTHHHHFHLLPSSTRWRRRLRLHRCYGQTVTLDVSLSLPQRPDGYLAGLLLAGGTKPTTKRGGSDAAAGADTAGRTYASCPRWTMTYWRTCPLLLLLRSDNALPLPFLWWTQQASAAAVVAVRWRGATTERRRQTKLGYSCRCPALADVVVAWWWQCCPPLLSHHHLQQSRQSEEEEDLLW